MVLLGAYAAKRCARRVHNEWDPTIETVAWEPPAELQARLDAGREFEADALDRLAAALHPSEYVDLRGLAKRAAVSATLDAMQRGVAVVIGAWLPDDEAGGRVGRPDFLVRAADGSGYCPGEVKGHKVVKAAKRGALDCSRFASPAAVETVEGLAPCKADRIDDYLQLAHYWRMLGACGHAAGVARGAVIGTDDLAALGGPVLVWLDLAEPLFTTYSRSEGKRKRSALERYDHEHAFRVRVAEAALRQAQEPKPEPLVQPIFIEECKSCPWFEYCQGIAGDTVSARVITGAFSRREWLALETAGCDSLEALAGLDVEDETFQAAYLPEVSHVPNPLGRLGDLVRRARMVRDGVTVERTTTGPIDVPRAEIEIDLDVEWDLDDHVYLWGALVRRPGAEPEYRPVVAWDVLDDEGERALAEEFVAWLRSVAASGKSVRVYHYSHAEVDRLTKVASGLDDLLPLFVDLLPIVRANYFGVDGLGIKKVAPAFGFEWRDESPSGLQSQLWLEDARHGSGDAAAAARTRLLAYNEDDVRATAVLRDGLARER
jgi:predicted RecB family nuclease